MRRLLPIAVALMLLAGCGGGGTIGSLDSGRGGDTPPTGGAPTTTPSPAPSPSAGDIPPGQEGDTPPSGDTGGGAPPAPTTSTVNACTLVTQADILNTTRRSPVHVIFTADPKETRFVSYLNGGMSTCHTPLESQWPDLTGTATVGGEVDVRIWEKGSDEFFPARPGDIAIPGLGVQALAHEAQVVVLLPGGGLLAVNANIPGPAADQKAQMIKWGTQLARIAVSRLG